MNPVSTEWIVLFVP